MALLPEINFRLIVAVRLDEEAGCWLSYCPTVDIYSAAETEHEAVNAITEALYTFIRECFQRRILDDVLNDRGLRAVPKDRVPEVTDPSGEAQFISVRLQEFGGKSHPIDISMSLATISKPSLIECPA